MSYILDLTDARSRIRNYELREQIAAEAYRKMEARAKAAEALVAELRTALSLCAFPNIVGGESSQLLDITQSRQAIARAALAKTPTP